MSGGNSDLTLNFQPSAWLCVGTNWDLSNGEH